MLDLKPTFALMYDLLLHAYNIMSRCTQKMEKRRPEIIKLFSIFKSQNILECGSSFLIIELFFALAFKDLHPFYVNL